MKDYIIPAILAVIVIFLLIDNISMRDEVSESRKELESAQEELNKKIIQLESAINQKDMEISDLKISVDEKDFEIHNLSSELADAENRLNETEKELEAKETSLEEYQDEFNELAYEIETIEDSLDESLQWLSENSRMTPQMEYFIPYTSRNCEDKNRLNLACIAFFMERQIGFEYIYEEEDKLYSIDEMISNGGGDCEDYSIFLKALINDYKARGSDSELLAWRDGVGDFLVYESSEREWYYEDAAGITLGNIDKVHPVLFCYVTSYSILRLEGHCMVALPEQQIESEKDLVLLEGAQTFEPQDGAYTGKIGREFYMCYDGDYDCGTIINDIFIVITDEDIYQFIDYEWKSLDEQKQKIDSLKNDIKEISSLT